MTQFENNIEFILRSKLYNGGFIKDHNGYISHMMVPYIVYISNICHKNDITMKDIEKKTLTSSGNKILHCDGYNINNVFIMSLHSYTECKYSN